MDIWLPIFVCCLSLLSLGLCTMVNWVIFIFCASWIPFQVDAIKEKVKVYSYIPSLYYTFVNLSWRTATSGICMSFILILSSVTLSLFQTPTHRVVPSECPLKRTLTDWAAKQCSRSVVTQQWQPLVWGSLPMMPVCHWFPVLTFQPTKAPLMPQECLRGKLIW